MDVYVNGAQVSELNYYKQNDYNEFSDDVATLTGTKVGDVIKVDLFCTLGGERPQELTGNAWHFKNRSDDYRDGYL